MNKKNQNSAKQVTPYELDAEKIKKLLIEKLHKRGVADETQATPEQLYMATVFLMKELLEEKRIAFKRRANAQGEKKVCYLCIEFLVGRSLKNNAKNMGIFSQLSDALKELGSSFEDVYACESDPGLGNGGLGRLAACFLDSLTALDYSAIGYSLCYENGLFRQRLVDGEQVELPDIWMPSGGAWLMAHPEKTVSVRLGGQVQEVWENGSLKIIHTEYEEVRAVPYDLMIAGADTDTVNTLRLWRARDARRGDTEYLSQSNYVQAMNRSGSAEEITRQLYPADQYDEGKLLRLTQQYFLASASLQNMISEYFATNGSLDGFEDKIAIHINDTHPVLCIPELMRILMDIYSYSWERAWEIVTKTVSYTNHTILPEALEKWRIDLFRVKLPRIYTIVEEINRRFCADLWKLYPGDWDRISRMAIVSYNYVSMANLSIVASHTVNGVSKLHSEILKKSTFRDFYKMTPWKFTNVTNGVVHRRWLCSANPELSDLLDECIGPDYRKDPSLLADFERFVNDDAILDKLDCIKANNKKRFADYASSRTQRAIDASSVFDVQIKRMHEYKRQLLNALKILSLYLELKENPSIDIQPQTFIFGAKAAPGYYMAKELIKLIYFLGVEIEAHPSIREKLRVLFMEDYNVSMAEVLIPSADISEQISLAGKEASGTGNMKLMMNGALTLGTLDGANVEILDAVGDRNIYMFGLNTQEVEELWRYGYDARSYYRASDRLRATIDRLSYPIGGQNFAHIADYLIGSQQNVADPFMCLADFESYRAAYDHAISDFANRPEWNRRSLVNIARSGRFASDNSIRGYANDVWHVRPISR